MWNLVVAVILSAVSLLASQKTPPSYLKICKAKDPNLSQCFRNSFEALRPYMTRDQPEINLPSIDPLRLSQLSLIQDNNSPNVRFNASLKDLELAGGSHFEVLDSKITLDPYYAQFHVRFPVMVMTGDYKANGRVLLFEFDSDGKMQGDFTEVDLDVSWTGRPYTKNGLKHVTLQPHNIDVKVGHIKIRIDDLFKGHPEITEKVNRAINENIDILYEDFLPVLRTALGEIITDYVNRFHDTFPIDVLYPQV